MTSDLQWTKSSHSGPQGGDCVEVAVTPVLVHIRDSKDIARPAITFSPSAWTAFLTRTGQVAEAP
ncbi:DUF397 domain-containing protein [Streptomyces sclerotialus]|uniref:DUF397 domain-containing protein n=1 Tax=Streptomyces sclerotialus TaxID=1957 RepID=UPI0004C7F1DA